MMMMMIAIHTVFHLLALLQVRRQDAGMYSCILTFSNYSVAAPFTYLVSASKLTCFTFPKQIQQVY